jgi:hypothetical protein
MRGLILVPLCLLAACSGGGGENKAEQAADALQAGQWEVSSEVSDFRSTDKSAPALKAAVGEKSAALACIEAGKEKEPPAALFAGAGYECEYKDRYVSGGRLNLSLECGRHGLQGKVGISVQGSFTGDSFEGTTTATSFLPGEGDFVMNSKIGGRRTGATCAARAAEGGANAAQPAEGRANASAPAKVNGQRNSAPMSLFGPVGHSGGKGG